MKPCRIQLSGVTATLFVLMISCGAALLPSRVYAQSCAGTLGSITYDTVVSSSITGGSTVGGSFTYKVPQFPVSAQTLYAVAIKSTVSASATATILNVSGGSTTPSVQLIRSDGLSSSATGSVPGMPAFSGSYTGADLASFSSEPVNMPDAIAGSVLINDSVTTASPAINNFSGSGALTFTYSSNNIPLPSPGMVTTGINVTDQVHFSITYYFCSGGTLATDILSFTAVRENEQTVLLDWITTNEQAGRHYDVELSKDGGQSFTTVDSRPSDASHEEATYTDDYPIASTESGKLYFRIRQLDADGMITYSPVRIVSLDEVTTVGFSIYPNPPSDYIQVTFPGPAQDWQVDIVSADGSLMQRNYFNGLTTVRVNFLRRLSAGIYFVRAFSAQSGARYTGSILVR